MILLSYHEATERENMTYPIMIIIIIIKNGYHHECNKI